MNADQTPDQEYLIPAPVLTSADKLFHFGPIGLSFKEIAELIVVGIIIYGLCSILAFLPWPILLTISIIIFFISFTFITQPINGLPGDVWIIYFIRFHLINHNQHTLQRSGHNYVQVNWICLSDSSGQTIIQQGKELRQKIT